MTGLGRSLIVTLPFVAKRGARAAAEFPYLINWRDFDEHFHVLALVACATLAGFALAQTGNRPATIVVRVPADATVTISGEKPRRRASSRRYATPDLAPGTYSYEIEVRWTAGGKEVKETRVVEFAAGQTATVDFTSVKGARPSPAA